jgi:CDGSH-type Zn-finger protein
MINPIIAEITPTKVNLDKGKEYYFCACGKSNKQPLCDGSHSGTNFKPRPFKVEEDRAAYLCQCKHTSNPPFCDGSHKLFTSDQIGKEGPPVDAT